VLFYLIFVLLDSALAGEQALGKSNSWCFKLSAQSSDSAKVDLPRPLFGKDKADHFVSSAFLTGLCFYIAREEYRNSREFSIGISLGVSSMVGISKEIYDKVSKKGTPSWRDLFADGIGIAVGILFIAGVQK